MEVLQIWRRWDYLCNPGVQPKGIPTTQDGDNSRKLLADWQSCRTIENKARNVGRPTEGSMGNVSKGRTKYGLDVASFVYSNMSCWERNGLNLGKGVHYMDWKNISTNGERCRRHQKSTERSRWTVWGQGQIQSARWKQCTWCQTRSILWKELQLDQVPRKLQYYSIWVSLQWTIKTSQLVLGSITTQQMALIKVHNDGIMKTASTQAITSAVQLTDEYADIIHGQVRPEVYEGAGRRLEVIGKKGSSALPQLMLKLVRMKPY